MFMYGTFHRYVSMLILYVSCPFQFSSEIGGGTKRKENSWMAFFSPRINIKYEMTENSLLFLRTNSISTKQLFCLPKIPNLTGFIIYWNKTSKYLKIEEAWWDTNSDRSPILLINQKKIYKKEIIC